MEEEIKVNDVVYVMKDTKKKDRIIGVMDAANVSMIFTILPEYLSGTDEEIITIPNPSLCFKKSGTLDDFTMSWGATSIKSKYGTKISKEMVKWASKLVHALCYENSSKDIIFAVYEGWNKETNEYKKEYPVVLVSSNWGILVAPRVDNE